MSRRTILIIVCALAAALAVVLTVDWLVVTDEERIDEFVETVTGPITRERIGKALTYVDPSRAPLLVRLQGEQHPFEGQSQEEFAAFARGKLAGYEGDRLMLLSQKVSVEGNRATVVVDTLSRHGRKTVEYQLRKLGEQWLVTEVRIQ